MAFSALSAISSAGQRLAFAASIRQWRSQYDSYVQKAKIHIYLNNLGTERIRESSFRKGLWKGETTASICASK